MTVMYPSTNVLHQLYDNIMLQKTTVLSIYHDPRHSADTSPDDQRPGVLCRHTPHRQRPATHQHLIAQPHHLLTSAEDTPVFAELP